MTRADLNFGQATGYLIKYYIILKYILKAL
jgi:hypothetical protein